MERAIEQLVADEPSGLLSRVRFQETVEPGFMSRYPQLLCSHVEQALMRRGIDLRKEIAEKDPGEYFLRVLAEALARYSPPGATDGRIVVGS